MCNGQRFEEGDEGPVCGLFELPTQTQRLLTMETETNLLPRLPNSPAPPPPPPEGTVELA